MGLWMMGLWMMALAARGCGGAAAEAGCGAFELRLFFVIVERVLAELGVDGYSIWKWLARPEHGRWPIRIGLLAS